jgi:hypothetical protein
VKYTCLNEKDGVVEKMQSNQTIECGGYPVVIRCAEGVEIRDDRWQQLVDWPFIRYHLKERQKKGFTVSEIIVEGAAFRNGNPIKCHAEVKYRTSIGHYESYSVDFVPDSASLYIIFRLSNEEECRRYKASLPVDRPYKPEDYQLLPVVQSRIGLGQVRAIETPGGYAKRADQDKRACAIQEGMEEYGFIKKGKFELPSHFPSISNLNLDPLWWKDGDSLVESWSMHPGIMERYHPYMAIVDVTREEFENIRREMDGKIGGDHADGEFTTVVSMPLEEFAVSASVPHKRLACLQAMSRAGIPDNIIMKTFKRLWSDPGFV